MPIPQGLTPVDDEPPIPEGLTPVDDDAPAVSSASVPPGLSLVPDQPPSPRSPFPMAASHGGAPPRVFGALPTDRVSTFTPPVPKGPTLPEGAGPLHGLSDVVAQDPFLEGLPRVGAIAGASALEGATSPESLKYLAVAPAAGPLAPAVSAKFAYDAMKDFLERHAPDIGTAIGNRDPRALEEAIGKGAASLGMAGLAGTHAARGAARAVPDFTDVGEAAGRGLNESGPPARAESTAAPPSAAIPPVIWNERGEDIRYQNDRRAPGSVLVQRPPAEPELKIEPPQFEEGVSAHDAQTIRAAHESGLLTAEDLRAAGAEVESTPLAEAGEVSRGQNAAEDGAGRTASGRTAPVPDGLELVEDGRRLADDTEGTGALRDEADPRLGAGREEGSAPVDSAPGAGEAPLPAAGERAADASGPREEAPLDVPAEEVREKTPDHVLLRRTLLPDLRAGRIVLDRDDAGEDAQGQVGRSLGAAAAGDSDLQQLSRVLPEDQSLPRQAFDELRGQISPTNVSPEAKRAAGILTQEGANRSLADFRAKRAMEPAMLAVDRLRDTAKAREMYDRMERGEPQATPELQKAADSIREATDASSERLAALGDEYAPGFIANYMAHLYKNVPLATSFFEGKAGTSKGFLKERTYEFRDEAIKAGLTPKFENPAENQLARIVQEDKYVAAVRAFERLKAEHLVEKFDSNTAAQPDWVRLDKSLEGAYGQTLAPGEYLAAPKPVALLMNRAMAAGLDSNAGFRAVRAANAMLNQAQLGISLFHAWTSIGNRFKSRLATGIQEMAQALVEPGMAESRGSRFLSGAMKAATSTAAVAIDWSRARKMLSDAAEGVDSPDIQNALMGGFRFSMDKDYVTGMALTFRRALAQGEYLKAAGSAIPAALETAAYPLMQELVPTLKAASYIEMFDSEVRRLGPNATAAQLTQGARRSMESVDNILGQLSYDNTFWNKAWRQSLQQLVRSVGWRAGTLRQGLGGAKDLATAPARYREIAGGKAAENLTDPVITARMAYIPAELIGSALIGSIYAYMIKKTTDYGSEWYGSKKDELKDWFFPQTGGLNKSKSQSLERIVPPGYMKDVYAYSHDPVSALMSGEAPLPSMAHDVITGRDYRDQPIRDPNADAFDKILQTGAHVGKQFVPFSLRQLLGTEDANPRSAISPLGRQFGSPAPAYIANPEKSDEAQSKKFRRKR